MHAGKSFNGFFPSYPHTLFTLPAIPIIECREDARSQGKKSSEIRNRQVPNQKTRPLMRGYLERQISNIDDSLSTHIRDAWDKIKSIAL
jgi:hypothetical protein